MRPQAAKLQFFELQKINLRPIGRKSCDSKNRKIEHMRRGSSQISELRSQISTYAATGR